MFCSRCRVVPAVRVALFASLVALSGCVRTTSPDLLESDARRQILSSEDFRGMRLCEAGGSRDIPFRRRLLKIQRLWRESDSEADFCYTAAFDWRWESDDGRTCREFDKVNHSYAEFRFGENRWVLFIVSGEGIAEDIYVQAP